MFHKHNFKESTNKRILYCECGKIKEIPCNHKWEVKSTQQVEIMRTNIHIQEIWVCENCGEIKSINTTTGVVE